MRPLTSEAKRIILERVNAVEKLQRLGVVVDVDGQSERIRKDKGCFHECEYLVIELQTDKKEDTNNVYKEAGLTAINCTAAVVASIVTFSSVGFAPFTSGISTFVTSTAYAATTATTLSCFNSAVRTYNAINSPSTNEHWDRIPAYRTTLGVLDAVSLVGVFTSGATTIRIVKILRRAGVSVRGAVTGNLSRQARAKIAREYLRTKEPKMTNRQIKNFIRTGHTPKRYSNMTLSVKTTTALKDSFAASLSFLASTLDGNIKNLRIYAIRLIN